jgi:SHS2 domain-containing protein
MPYEITPVDHTADIGITVTGPTLADVFAGAAHGMFALTFDLAGARPDRQERLALHAADRESLLVAWLQELLVRGEIEERVVTGCRFERLEDTELAATVSTAPLGPEVPQIGAAVKAVTYYGLDLHPTPDGWQATIVFDV